MTVFFFSDSENLATLTLNSHSQHLIIMGKGGEQDQHKTSSLRTEKLKLQHLSDEELKNWAKAYLLPENQDREQLLLGLVSSITNTSSCTSL